MTLDADDDLTAPVPAPVDIFMDPAASYWIKFALKTALTRDIVDAANDADVLAAVLSKRCGELLAAYENQAGLFCAQCGYTMLPGGSCGCTPISGP